LRQPGTYKLRMTVYDKYAPHAEGSVAGTKWVESDELEIEVRDKAPAGKVEPAKGLKLTLSADKTETRMRPDGKNAVPVKLKLTFTNDTDKPIKLDAYVLQWRMGFRCVGPTAESVKASAEYIKRPANFLPPRVAEDSPVLQPGKSWSPDWTRSLPGDIEEGYGKAFDYAVSKPGTYKLRVTLYENLIAGDEPQAKRSTWLESNELELKVREKDAAEPAKSDKEMEASDRDKLQGTWVVVFYEVDGKVDPSVVRKDCKLTIEGKRFTLFQELAEHFPHGTFTLDAASLPKAIDFTQTHGLPREEAELIPGVYEFDGETLRIGRAIWGGKRPTDFTTKPRSGRELLVFRRPEGQKEKAALENLPDLEATTYRVDPYVRAAAMLHDMGKDKATDALSKLARGHEHDNQVIVLCRMLFTPKAKGKFRRPALGAALLLGDTGDADWPLEPIELVDGVPCLIPRLLSAAS
jgi:uncharacterized protein (TIGR03067 family)